MPKYFVPLVATPPLDNGGGGGGGSDLPAVSAADNGDVLTVVNGQWDKAAPSGGGGGVLVVHATYDELTETSTLDKTAQEISSAFQNGFVYVDESEGVGTRLRLQTFIIIEDNPYFFEMGDYYAESPTDYPANGGK